MRCKNRTGHCWTLMTHVSRLDTSHVHWITFYRIGFEMFQLNCEYFVTVPFPGRTIHSMQNRWMNVCRDLCQNTTMTQLHFQCQSLDGAVAMWRYRFVAKQTCRLSFSALMLMLFRDSTGRIVGGDSSPGLPAQRQSKSFRCWRRHQVCRFVGKTAT